MSTSKSGSGSVPNPSLNDIITGILNVLKSDITTKLPQNTVINGSNINSTTIGTRTPSSAVFNNLQTGTAKSTIAGANGNVAVPSSGAPVVFNGDNGYSFTWGT